MTKTRKGIEEDILFEDHTKSTQFSTQWMLQCIHTKSMTTKFTSRSAFRRWFCVQWSNIHRVLCPSTSLELIMAQGSFDIKPWSECAPIAHSVTMRQAPLSYDPFTRRKHLQHGIQFFFSHLQLFQVRQSFRRNRIS